MGKGRSPCCDKAKVKRGPWSEAEDLKLISFIQKHGHPNWRALPRLAGLARCGKSCRLRWVNYLCPDVKRGNFTPKEEESIIELHERLGNKWSKIAAHLPGRTDNEIKNVWNTHLKKRVATRQSTNSPSPNQDSTISYQTSLSNRTELFNSTRKEQVMHQTSPINDTLDPLISSPSISCSSNVTFSNQFTKSNPESEPIEIPFEPNLDLWELLDEEMTDFEPPSHINLESRDKEDISWCWLQYLENELGLHSTTTKTDKNWENIIPGSEPDYLDLESFLNEEVRI